jgi:hypothetical protein
MAVQILRVLAVDAFPRVPIIRAFHCWGKQMMVAVGVRFQWVISQTNRAIFEIKLNPRSCRIFRVPVAVLAVIRSLVIFVAIIRRTRDVDNAMLVDIPAALWCKELQNARPRRWKWIECARIIANFNSKCRIIFWIENDSVTNVATNAWPKARIQQWMRNLWNKLVDAFPTQVLESNESKKTNEICPERD